MRYFRLDSTLIHFSDALSIISELYESRFLVGIDRLLAAFQYVFTAYGVKSNAVHHRVISNITTEVIISDDISSKRKGRYGEITETIICMQLFL